jgi:hypothetical protein
MNGLTGAALAVGSWIEIELTFSENGLDKGRIVEYYTPE